MSPLVLATAVELSLLHGVRYAAAYLHESGVSIEVALDLLARSPATLPDMAQLSGKWSVRHHSVPLKDGSFRANRTPR